MEKESPRRLRAAGRERVMHLHDASLLAFSTPRVR